MQKFLVLLSAILCTCLLCASVSPALPKAGQETLPSLENLPVPQPLLVPAPLPVIPRVQVKGAELPVRLVSAAVSIRIQEAVAETCLEMLVSNPNSRALEGELHIPLLPRQEISGMALDINGVMREAVPVDKMRAREIFEHIVRKALDPALLESVRSNVYALRVFPLPARGVRRVAVRIMEPLVPVNGQWRYSLPLDCAGNLDSFSMEVIVTSPAGPPAASAPGFDLALVPTGTEYRAKAVKKNLAPSGRLDISLPCFPAVGGAARVAAVRWQDRVFVGGIVPVPVRTSRRSLPELVTLVWDASGSGESRDHEREFALLDRYFAALGSGTARLIVVRDIAEPARTFPVANGNWDSLKDELNAMVYDGGTDLASWTPDPDCREFLLFSDGIANYGRSLTNASLPPLLPHQRLFDITASTLSDQALLERAARQGGIVDLMHSSPEEAASQLLHERSRVRADTDSLGGKAEVFVAPVRMPEEMAGPAGPGEEAQALYRIVGMADAGALGAQASITLMLTHPDGATTALPCTLPESIPTSGADLAPLTARLWARAKIADLERDMRRNRQAILDLGVAYGVLSRGSSLLVLETAKDYVTYRIPAPPELAGAVTALRQASPSQPAVQLMPMHTLLRRWQAKTGWWNQDFPMLAKRDPRWEGLKKAIMDSFNAPDLLPGGGSGPAPAAAGRSQTASVKRPSVAPPGRPSTPEPSLPSQHNQAAAAGDKTRGRAAHGSAAIRLAPVSPDVSYLKRLQDAPADALYALYLEERPACRQSASFFLDAADLLLQRGRVKEGLRVLSNLAELDPENRRLLRSLAYRLMQAQEYALALPVLDKVLDLAPVEPLALRDKALCLKALGREQEAAELLYQVALRDWGGRFGHINEIALTELNALLTTAKERLNAAILGKAFLKALGADGDGARTGMDPRLRKNLTSDIRVVLPKESDDDMDAELFLIVTDPSGEEASMLNPLTPRGGLMSNGWVTWHERLGAEEFMLKRAAPGRYVVDVFHFCSAGSRTEERILPLTLFTRYGSPEEKARTTILRLKPSQCLEQVRVGEFVIP
jgi:hypothetical protein